MTLLDSDQFNERVWERFGDRVFVSVLTASQETIDNINQECGCHLTAADFQSYGKKAWLLKNECPECGSPLDGLFGSFQWSIWHGIGKCSNCNKVEFQLYHYFGDNERPVMAFAVTGFAEEDDETEESRI